MLFLSFESSFNCFSYHRVLKMEELYSVVLGIRISQDSLQRVVLPAVNLDCKVEDIRAEAVKQTGLSPDQICE